MSFIRKLFKKGFRTTKPFKQADAWELNSTPFGVATDTDNSIYWTPMFNKKQAPEDLLLYLQDCGYYKEYDVHTRDVRAIEIQEMVEAFVDAAFEDQEFYHPAKGEGANEIGGNFT